MKRRAVAAVMAFAMATSTFTSGAGAVTAVNPVGTLVRVNADALAAFGSIVDPSAMPFSTYAMTAGTLLPLPGAGQVWQVYPYVDNSANTGVLVRDEATLAPITSFVIADRLRRGASFGGEWMNATDGGNRVFLAGANSIIAVDLATFAVSTVAPVGYFPGNVAGLDGLTYDPTADDLYALYTSVPSFNVAHAVGVMRRIDLSTGTSESRVIRSCRGFPSTEVASPLATPILIGPADLYVACSGPKLGGATSPTHAVVRLPLATAFDPLGAEQEVVRPGRIAGVLVDEASGRLLVADDSGALTAFDTATMTSAWSISVAAGFTDYGLGHNPTSGEVYVQSSLGFSVVDGRSTAAPTPFTLTSAAAAGRERIVSQTGTTRVLVLPGSSFSTAASYTIYDVVP